MNMTVLFGGSSYEHEISIVSAITLKKVLKRTQLQFVFVDAHREFYLIEPANMTSKHFSSGAYKKAKKLTLKKGGFVIEGRFGSKTLESGTVLNLIHGRDGEDGKIAAMLEFYGVPYIGPRLEAGALSYSKLTTKFWPHHSALRHSPTRCSTVRVRVPSQWTIRSSSSPCAWAAPSG